LLRERLARLFKALEIDQRRGEKGEEVQRRVEGGVVDAGCYEKVWLKMSRGSSLGDDAMLRER